MTTSTAQTMLELANNEQYLFEAADIAYFKAGRTSDPQDWLEAGLLARQHRNALTALRAAQPAAQAPAGTGGDVKQWLIDLIRNEYDKAPDYLRAGDNWDDGAERIADAVLSRLSPPDAVRAAAHAAFQFLQDKSFIPASANTRCTKICEQLEAALAPPDAGRRG